MPDQTTPPPGANLMAWCAENPLHAANLLDAKDTEIARLRTAIRVNGLRFGATDAEIDAVLDDTTYPTPLQRAAAIFVATLAENVDAQAGLAAPNGTPETRGKVIDIVMDRFFSTQHHEPLDKAAGFV